MDPDFLGARLVLWWTWVAKGSGDEAIAFTYEAPAAYSEGIPFVAVNGELVVPYWPGLSATGSGCRHSSLPPRS